MPTYIGKGFITSFKFLWDIGEKIDINKNNVLTYKNKIIDYLKEKYKLNELYILHKKDSIEIAIFYNIIQTADPYCILDLSEKKDVSENFKIMKNDIEPDKDINLIVYSI
jgi:hypothetical protein